MNELKMHENKLAILVLSCDKNCDLWPPFFSFYQKYWKDCNYNVYLGTNFLKFEKASLNISMSIFVSLIAFILVSH